MFNQSPPHSFQERFAPAFLAETQAFADFALGVRERFDGASARSSVEATLVAEACERSRANHEVVRLKRNVCARLAR
jgi:hypothetical protein